MPIGDWEDQRLQRAQAHRDHNAMMRAIEASTTPAAMPVQYGANLGIIQDMVGQQEALNREHFIDGVEIAAGYYTGVALSDAAYAIHPRLGQLVHYLSWLIVLAVTGVIIGCYINYYLGR